MVPPVAPTADFSSANGANGLVNFTDLSDGYPTQWAWTFGDGGTSTSQNPSHTYAANGTYTVCLIATNAGGSSTQVCKQVTVSNVPATPVANFSWANPSGGLVNFTDLSTNTPTQWAWTFGDGGTSNLQNPNHVYAANNTYNVCLTATNTAGSNQVCKNVTVTGVSASNNAPVAVNDTVTVTGGSSQIIHVAANDVDPDNDNLCMTAVWGSPYATEYIGGSCDMILYEPDSSFSGNDTCYYSVCDDGTPVLCDTGMVVFTVNELNLPPVAVNDAANVTQPNPVVVNVGTNDSDPNGNNICVTAVYGSSAFTVAATGNCTSVEFAPDSTFTGNDTCWYVLCDNGTPVLCDTGILVVTVNANTALLPVADFTASSDLFPCGSGWTEPYGTNHSIYNNSQNADSLVWSFSPANNDGNCQDSLKQYYTDTVIFNVSSLSNEWICDGWGVGGFPKLAICLTVFNEYGSDTKCDTFCIDAWESISEIALSNISLYPNPASSMLTIDMKENEDEITRNYSSIEVYNTLGEKVKAIQRKDESRTATFSIADLANGMYVATITAANGQRSTLGRFTVNH
jgi:PKD repeat protein